MGASTAFQALLLNHLFTNSAIANVGDTTGLPGSGTAGNLYIALHTADPSAGNQSTSETTYTGYARIPVARTAGGWTVSSGSYDNTADITFGQCTAGSATLTHFSIGTALTGTGTILLSGALTSSLAVSSGVQPKFSAGQLSGTVS